MTVNNKAPVTGPTLSDGVKIDWPFDFKITAASQMTLIVRDMVTLNNETVTTGFTIDAAYIDNDTGGYVRYQPGGNPLPAGKGVFTVREVPYTQPFRIGNQGAFWPQTHEKALDDIVMQVQQVVGTLGRTAFLPIGATNEDLEELLADVVRLAASADNIDIVAGIAPAVSTVAGIAANVTTVAGIAANVTTVDGIAAAISTVAAIAANVTKVANNAAAVVNVSKNMAAVQAAVASAEKAYQWAENPEYVPVEPGEFSARHWAKKAEETVAAGVADGSVTIPKLGHDTVALINANVKYLGPGAPLPVADVGPIWHADYGGILTWQVFNANGANYTGYASENIGQWANEGQNSARRGWLKRNGAKLLKADFPALWNYALHKGLVGVWAVGTIVFENTSGTKFKLPDTRGYFDRPWSDGAAMDSGRAFGVAQGAAVGPLGFAGNPLPKHTHTVYGGTGTGGINALWSGGFGAAADKTTAPASAGTPTGKITGTGAETRPANTAPLGVLKF